jgi:NAD(P)-dependent dehydrogenase (short-subunit alcohol dehydrogenase family)
MVTFNRLPHTHSAPYGVVETDAPKRLPIASGQRPAFADKVALVTGSESGIGKATARALCEQGAKVILNGLHADRLRQTEEELSQQGYSVVSCLADVTDYAQCEVLIETAIQYYGRLDVLITNASISMRAYFTDLTPDVFKRVLDSNVYGSVYPLKAALRYLTESAGSVTFISSISALNGMPSGSAYCAGKAALANLAHTLRLELHDTGIHIGVVHIGFTQNDPEKRVLDALGQPVPIAYRNPRWQMTQAQVAQAILEHIRRRRQKTILSPAGKLNYFMNRHLPGLADRIVLWTMKHWAKFYE